MKTVLLLAVLVGFTCSPSHAQGQKDYELWASWETPEKASFVGGALSQLPKICEIIAGYYARKPGSNYTAIYYHCLTKEYQEAMDSIAVMKEMDRLYQNPEMRNRPLGKVYRIAVKNLNPQNYTKK